MSISEYKIVEFIERLWTQKKSFFRRLFSRARDLAAKIRSKSVSSQTAKMSSQCHEKFRATSFQLPSGNSSRIMPWNMIHSLASRKSYFAFNWFFNSRISFFVNIFYDCKREKARCFRGKTRRFFLWRHHQICSVLPVLHCWHSCANEHVSQ